MLKINLWMQYKIPQPKLKVLQLKFKVWQLNPANNNVPVDQNVPIQPPHQLAPAQLVPAALVVPAPQVVYQNWVGKKPEFSGKPEEDAESHLLSTRDWMEAHNFPYEVKVRHFCLTLTGEARLWYESLAP